MNPDHLEAVAYGQEAPEATIRSGPAGQDAAGWVARALQDEREARGVTIGQLASQLGMPASAVSRWARGQCLPTVDELDSLSQAIGWNQPAGKWMVTCVVQRAVVASTAGDAARQVRLALSEQGRPDKMVVGSVQRVM